MLRTGLTVLLLLSLLVAASCGTATIDALAGAHIVSAELDTAASIGADGAQVALRPLADGGYELRAEQLDGAKLLVGHVDYDPQTTRLVESRIDGTDAADGVAGDDRLSIVVDRPNEGRVHFAMVLLDYENRPGLDGATTLAQLRFADGPAQVRQVLRAPDGAGPVNLLTLEGSVDAEGHAVLTWKEVMQGDGDNNGEVNPADIAPLSPVFLSQPDPDATDPLNSRRRDADYDGNGEVNGADLARLGAQLGTTLGGYQILAGPVGGTLSEVERFPRAEMFPVRPSAADGEQFWTWRSDQPLAADTDFQVRPYDNTPAQALGRISENRVTLLQLILEPTITDIQIEFDDPDSVVLIDGSLHRLVITEGGVDGQFGNAEPFTLESLQLRAMADTEEDPGNLIDATADVIWVLTGGAGLATIGMTAGNHGLLTPKDRGTVTVEAHVAGNFNIKDTFVIELASIDSIELTSGGGGGPVNVSSGTTVPFVAMGTFDSDNDPLSGNEVVIDITPYVNWAQLLEPTNTGTFSIETATGALNTDNAASGDAVRVSAEFPGTDVVTIGDNQKRASSFVQVSIN